jgi:hypothetical protein
MEVHSVSGKICHKQTIVYKLLTLSYIILIAISLPRLVLSMASVG